nr:uncharacterized protein K02A2.6-like [Misgurnus anguillicaudatus]
MAVTIGHMEAFDESVEPWTTYIERFEHFIEANSIDVDKKVPVLLSVVGGKTYGLLRSLIAPEKLREKSFKHITDTLQQHFSPKPLIIAERFRFHRRNQEEGESVTQYVAVLRGLSEHCEFGGHLDDALRDRFVCGLKSEATQKRLLTETTLTFQRAVELAVSMETASREAHQLSGSLTVNALSLLKNKTANKCKRCGKDNHSDDDCWFKDKNCNTCGKKGHISRVCRKSNYDRKTKSGNRAKAARQVKKSGQKGYVKKESVHHVDADAASSDDETDSELALYKLSQPGEKSSIIVKPEVEGIPLEMELDTGAAVSLISTETYNKILKHLPLCSTDIVLRTYTGQALNPEGVIDVHVKMGKQTAVLPLYVVHGDYPPLYGREWLRQIKLNWKEIKTVKLKTLGAVLEKHAAIFSKQLGEMKSIKAKITLKPEHKPKFCQPRVVPYALRPKVEEELNRLTEIGVLSPVQYSEWATPIVPVVKKNGAVRICGDFKVTINPVLLIEHYPLPRIEDLFASLAGGQCFSKLDLSHAYLQMRVEEESMKFLTISTQKGLFQYKRLPFGIASAPAIFQRAMDQVLLGLSNVHCYLDDILVTGRTEAEHLENLDAVLGRLEEFGLHVEKGKCDFFKDSLEYLGHIIDAEGLHKSPEKVSAIVNAPTPSNITQLRSFLGLLNYYGRFIPNLATIASPLNALLCKGKRWQWSSECEGAFKKAKEQLVSQNVLTHYDPQNAIRLACDASPYGIGAVISHMLPSGEEKPIAFASRTLSKAEQNYAQIEREALAIVFGVRKFHQYLYGRKFTLFTDHRPLTTIFGPQNGIPSMAAARMQRWALLLSAHNYTIEYKRGEHHANADGLSRLPLQVEHREKKDAVELFYLRQVEKLPVSATDIRHETMSDTILSTEVEMVLKGTQAVSLTDNNALSPFISKCNELSVQQGCLMRGLRVVVPHKLRKRVLEELHTGHPGIVRMKSIARSYVWWPGIDADIELQVKMCQSCQQIQKMPPQAPLHPWEWPSKPWERIHVDFGGPCEGYMYLVVVDAHSKWPEVRLMTSTTAGKTIDVLRNLFSHYGLPEVLVSDNGPQFVSQELANFLKANHVKHIRSAPYHPATNGQAERFVQSLKQALKASKGSSTLQKRLETFLLTYRNTPHPTTKESPSLLFLGRHLRTRLDALRPSVAAAVRFSQTSQVLRRAGRSKQRQLGVGDVVLARDYRGRERWTPGVVTAQSGPVSYTVDVGASEEWRRHTDQLLSIPNQTAETQLKVLPDNTNVPVPVQNSVNASSSTPLTETRDGIGDTSTESQMQHGKLDISPAQVIIGIMKL